MRPSISTLAQTVTRREVWLPSLLSGLTHYVLFAATFGFLPILGQRLGLGDVAQELLVSLNLASQAVGNLGVAALSQRIGSRRLTYLSFVCLALGASLTAVATHAGLFLLAQVCSPVRFRRRCVGWRRHGRIGGCGGVGFHRCFRWHGGVGGDLGRN